MTGEKNQYQIGEASKKSGVPIDTIRYYESLGLLEKPVRSEGGFRLYSIEAIEKLCFIKKAQSFGLTLSDIQRIMQESKHGLKSCCGFVGELFKKKLDELETKMRQLRRTKQNLKSLMKSWIPLKEAKKKTFVVCPQIETERPRKNKGGTQNVKKKR